MLVKILFSAAVIAGALLWLRVMRKPADASRDADVDAEADSHDAAPSVRAVAFGLLGVVLIASLAVFALKLRHDYRIIELRITSGDAVATYHARQKSIRGRRFTTLDGARITLGENDRIETTELD